MNPSSQNRQLFVVAIAYFSFIVLGMPGAMLGVAWSPYMRETFDQPRDAVALVLFASTAGYFLASFVSGWLMARLPAASLLALSCTLGAMGVLGYAIAPSFTLLVLAGLFGGTGAGILDGGMNVYFAAHYGPRLMNWLHACFGIGSTLAPLMMDAILNSDTSWRIGPAIIGGMYLSLVVLFLLTRQSWPSLKMAHQSEEPVQHANALSTLRMPIVWLGIILFMAYAGVELSAGQWSFSLFHEERGVSESAARFWVSLYWGSFTIGRIFFGAVINRVNTHILVQSCLGGAAVGMALLWWNPSDTVSFVGLVIYGFMLAPIFALMVTNTQERLGPSHAPNAIGFQVAAASIGAGGIPGLVGIIAEGSSLEIVPPFLFVLVIVMAAAYIAINRPKPVMAESL
ncbi:MAG: MFS transporter [Chloroflexota bacterium]|nr:MFS transporter [Chloroflexota bacterium]NOG63481.1 MFS transporter [Chloroflexota bacterium]GIK62341.1 MAG: MFS transporter [Chloroflexota bacterium]